MTHLSDVICIIDDDDAFRSATARLLRLRGHDVAEYATAAAFLDDLRSGMEPACILLDVRMPGMTGPGLQDCLTENGLAFPIIFLTGFGDVPTVVKAIKAGAEDVLTKPVSERDLSECIARALAKFRVGEGKRQWEKNARLQVATLTPREREVFDYVVRGKMNKQTARDLGITERTIKAHRQRIFEKLEARTVADLVSMAERLGLMGESGPSAGAGSDPALDRH